jgi:hypothetical protein
LTRGTFHQQHKIQKQEKLKRGRGSQKQENVAVLAESTPLRILKQARNQVIADISR